MARFDVYFVGGPLDGKVEPWERAPQDLEPFSMVLCRTVYEYEFRFGRFPQSAFVFQRALSLTRPTP